MTASARGEFTTRDVVLGAGSLGIALLFDLVHKNKNNSSLSVVSANRTPRLPFRISSVSDPSQAEKDFTADEFWTAGSWPSPSPNHCARFFVCVQPEFTGDALGDIARWCASAAAGNVDIILCGNGLASREPVLNDLARSTAVRRIERALFYCGFEPAQFATEGTAVLRRGGNSVIHGALHCTGAAPFEPPQGVLQWRSVEDVANIERAKFFVNFILAAHIGPNPQRNGTLRGHLSDARAIQFARAFAKFDSSAPMDADALLKVLWTTVDATAENVNSVSLAGARGRPGTFRYFLKQLEGWLLASSGPRDAREGIAELIAEANDRWKGNSVAWNP